MGALSREKRLSEPREVREGLATGHRELLRGAQTTSKTARRNDPSASGRSATPHKTKKVRKLTTNRKKTHANY